MGYHELYEWFSVDAPMVINPRFDSDKPEREQLVHCMCGKSFRVIVNGKVPISDVTMTGVNCPHCGQSAKNALAVHGHSGGVFNATLERCR